jgi:hypothetical protein
MARGAGWSGERSRANILNEEDAVRCMEPVRLTVVLPMFLLAGTRQSMKAALWAASICRHKTHAALMERSAALQLLESFPDQLLKLLRLRHEGLYPLLHKLRLKRRNILEALCVADLAGKREH